MTPGSELGSYVVTSCHVVAMRPTAASWVQAHIYSTMVLSANATKHDATAQHSAALADAALPARSRARARQSAVTAVASADTRINISTATTTAQHCRVLGDCLRPSLPANMMQLLSTVRHSLGELEVDQTAAVTLDIELVRRLGMCRLKTPRCYRCALAPMRQRWAAWRQHGN